MSAVSVKLFQAILAGAAAQGVQPAALLPAAGLTSADVGDPDGRLAQDSNVRLWNEAGRLTGDPCFGLHLAEHADVGAFGGLGFAVRSSSTLGDGYRRAARYLRLMHTGVRLHIEEDADTVRLWIEPPGAAPPPHHAIEFFVAVLARMGQIGLGTTFAPREAFFTHPAPAVQTEHLRLLGPRVRFGQPRSGLLLDRAQWSLPQVQAEPLLCEVLDRHLQDLTDRLPEAEHFLERVRRCLASELQHGEPALERVAERLHMSPRTLQRRLQQEGHTLNEVLCSLRADLAVRYLSEQRESISEIAFLLGFSEVSTFHRAFKRWTGVTPAAYRRSGKSSTGPR